MTNAKILIVQDDHPGVADLRERLESLRYTVCATVPSGREAVEKAEEMRPDLALIDLGLDGDVDGIEAAEQIGSRFDIPVIYLTDDADEDLLQRARTTHPFGYVLQPFEERQLDLNIQTALSLHERDKRRREANIQSERTIADVQSQSQPMETVFNRIGDGVVVADADGSVRFINSTAKRIVDMEATEPSSDQSFKLYSTLAGALCPDKETPFPVDELPLMRAIRGEASDDVEVFIRNQENPEGVHINISGKPLRDEAGAVTGGVAVIRDITRLKETEAELKQTVRSLQEQTRLMETIFDSISDGVAIIDDSGKGLTYNSSAKRITGIEEPETIELEQRPAAYGFFLPDGETPFPADQLPLERAMRGEASDDVEIFIRNPNVAPEGVTISGSGRPLKDADGVLQGGVVVFRDITRLKETEAELRQTVRSLQDQTRLMETVFDSMSDGVAVVDENGKYLIRNSSAIRITGIDEPETKFEQRSARYGLFLPDGETLFPVDQLPLVRAIRGEASDDVEAFIRNPNVAPEGVSISSNGRPLRDDTGAVKGGVIVFRDITRLKETEAELKQTVRSLQEQTQLMETVFDSISDGVAIIDDSGKGLTYNSSAKRITGIEEPETIELEQRPAAYGFFLPDGETPFPVDQLPLVRAMRGEASDDVEIFGCNPNVAPEGVIISVSGRPLRDEAGTVTGGVAVLRDITRLKETEAELRQTVHSLQDQTRLMETVFDSMSDGVIVVDKAREVTFFNPSAERILGYSPTDITPEQWVKTYGIFLPDEKTPFPYDDLPLRRTLRGEAVDHIELFIRNQERPAGVHISVSGRPLRDDTGATKGGLVVFRDIAELKKTETELKQTVRSLQDQTRLMETVFDSISDGVAVVDENGKHLIYNPSARRITGVFASGSELAQRPAMYGLYYNDQETLYPADQLPLMRAMRGEASDEVEMFIRNQERPAGVHISVSGRPLRDDTDVTKGGVIVFRDVTRLKKTEAELKQTVRSLQDQTRLMETVFNSMSDGVLVADKESNITLFNPSAERLGYRPMDITPEQWVETYGIFLPDEKTPFPADDLPLRRAIRGEAVDHIELFIRNQERPAGVQLSVSGRPLRDDTGVTKGGVIVLRDVAKLKETEAELKETVRSLQDQTRLMETVFDSISDGVAVVDENGKHLIYNPSARRITGIYEPETGLEQRPARYGLYLSDQETLFPVDELPLARAMRGEASDEVEVFISNPKVRPEGVCISVNGRPLRDAAGVLKGGVILFRDVTRLKKTEDELQQAVDSLRSQTHAMETVFNSISDGVVVADENGKFTIFNPSAERIVGIGMTDAGPEQWTDQYGIFFPDRVTPVPTDEIPLVRAMRGEAMDEEEMFIRNPRIPKGVYISVSGRPLRDDEGVTKGGVIVFRDVTERMRAEEALTQAFAQGQLEVVDTILHNIGNAINSVTVGMGTIHEQLAKNDLVHRLSALAKAIEAHRDDWIPYLQTDPQGQKVMPFLLALAKDFDRQNTELKQTVERVRGRVTHIVDIIRTQRSLDSGTMARKDINLRKAITDAVRLVQDSLTQRDIRIHIDCQNAPKEIRIQESKFHQMLVNLIKNAMEAIDELAKSGGFEAQPVVQIRSYVEEAFLVLDVIDNGIGIEGKRSRIVFTAGYTTKETGSGLGLHSTANFVIGSGGQISALSSGIGQGTTMRIKLRLSSVSLKSEELRGG